MTRTEMPVALHRYVIAVVVGGPLVVLAVTFIGFEWLSLGDWIRALLLLLLAVLTSERPLRVGHKYSYDVSEVVYVAIILLFPVAIVGLLILLVGGLRLLPRPRRPLEDLFNLGQAVIHVTTGAFCLVILREWATLGPPLAGLAPLGAIGLSAVAMLLTNTALVSGAIALDTDARFWRLWRGEIVSVGGTFAALAALGVVVALIVRDYPLALLPLALPAGLAQYALRREVQLRADTRAALAGLVDVIELRDPYTAGHSERVAALARRLALRLGLTGEEADLIETAGRVHDLGKTGMGPALIDKEGPLSEEEWREMRRHPELGAAVVARFAGYGDCADLVRHHHERWDGAGYPDGLAGEQIPIGARILAVADAFDALTTTRSYRPARGPDVALRILEEGADSQWDRRVVEALAAHQSEAAVCATVAAPRPVLA